MHAKLFANTVVPLAEEVMGATAHTLFAGTTPCGLHIALIQAHNAAGRLIVTDTNPDNNGYGTARVGLTQSSSNTRAWYSSGVKPEQATLSPDCLRHLGNLGLIEDGKTTSKHEMPIMNIPVRTEDSHEDRQPVTFVGQVATPFALGS